jgi:hypothetical protein
MSREVPLFLITQIESARATQQTIDGLYSDLCDFYPSEMNKWFEPHSIYPVATTQLGDLPSHFGIITDLWKPLCKAEREYLRTTGAQRTVRRRWFHDAQKGFDHMYRGAERKYRKDKIAYILNNYQQMIHNNFGKLLNNWGHIVRLASHLKYMMMMDIL